MGHAEHAFRAPPPCGACRPAFAPAARLFEPRDMRPCGLPSAFPRLWSRPPCAPHPLPLRPCRRAVPSSAEKAEEQGIPPGKESPARRFRVPPAGPGEERAAPSGGTAPAPAVPSGMVRHGATARAPCGASARRHPAPEAARHGANVQTAPGFPASAPSGVARPSTGRHAGQPLRLGLPADSAPAVPSGAKRKPPVLPLCSLQSPWHEPCAARPAFPAKRKPARAVPRAPLPALSREARRLRPAPSPTGKGLPAPSSTG